MRFAYADPPYLGCGALYKKHHADAMDWNDLHTHAELILRLTDEYPDGWSLSASSPSLKDLLMWCPDDVRVGAWVKPFAVFKTNVNPAYAWEPVIFRGGRRGDRNRSTVRDWFSKEITLRKGLTGAKPASFCKWILDLLGFDPEQDTLDDLFPGTGIMGEVIAGLREENDTLPLFGVSA